MSTYIKVSEKSDRVKPCKAHDKADTKVKILDAAESLFAHNGFHATSLRNITNSAGVNLAAVNYHFGSKEALLEAVFLRRVVPLNARRKEAIEAVIEQASLRGLKTPVSDIVRAFIEPTLRFMDSDGGGSRDFILLVGRLGLETNETSKKIFFSLVAPFLQFLMGVLSEALPDIEPKTLLWRTNFMVGSLAHTMTIYGSDTMPEPMQSLAEVEIDTLIDMLSTFVSAGMVADES